jgi:2-keto-4-pentenoate hydratase/2-oxohepta-3-ene-1,7-dioic acid hydratase in catechol pathway
MSGLTTNNSKLTLIFQGELCVVIGKEGKNISPASNPLDYVLGYTAGNDISSRFWQLDKDRSGGQFSYAKSFDKFAPIGPTLCSTSYIPDPSKLHLKTMVNGIQKQRTGIDDLIFDVSAIIRHVSRGMTLRPGTVIMTGTPSGVAAFETPPGWLKNGDLVQVEVEGIGRIENKMVFENM